MGRPARLGIVTIGTCIFTRAGTDAFSASSRLFDLNGEANSTSKKRHRFLVDARKGVSVRSHRAGSTEAVSALAWPFTKMSTQACRRR
jgi:hypothetical protein